MLEILIAENNTPLNSKQLSILTKNLPNAMAEQANKFRRWQDAQAFLLGKFLLREGLNKFGFNERILHDVQYTSFNRPYVSTGIDFNISHSGKYIVCVISKLYKVGIDIEEIRTIDIQDFTSQFTEEELANIQEAENKPREFFKYWTIKEAVIKADGRGLNIPLQQIILVGDCVMLTDKTWFIREVNVGNGYIAHVATDALIDDEIRITKMPVPELL